MPTPLGKPQAGDRIINQNNELIGVVVKRGVGKYYPVTIWRPGRKVTGYIQNFPHWQQRHGWRVVGEKEQ